MWSKRRIALWFLALVLMGPMVISFMYAPWLGYYRKHNPRQTSFMRYQAQRAAQHGFIFTPRYSYVPLSEISPYLVKAVLIAEDGRFYNHRGIDLVQVWYSYWYNWRAGKTRLGGSTITMQLCKNLFLSPQKTYSRKYIEMLLALRMEMALPKWRILELYLNVIEWGRGIYGIESAAHYYFNKSARDLNEVESVYLASIIINPKMYHRYDEPTKFLRRRMDSIYSILRYRDQQLTLNYIPEEKMPEIPWQPNIHTDEQLEIFCPVRTDVIELAPTQNNAPAWDNALDLKVTYN